MKEFWLIQDNEAIRLPVPPSKYSIKSSLNNATFTVEGLGEVSFIGKPKLGEITPIESFFPNQKYDFVQYQGFRKPQDYVDLLQKWRLSGEPIRYIITGTNVNILCSIESFEYKEEDGTGDIYFTLELKEYRLITAPSLQVSQITSDVSFVNINNLINARTIDKAIPTQIIARAGENLYTLIKRVTGNTTSLPSVATKNNISDVTSDITGRVIIL